MSAIRRVKSWPAWVLMLLSVVALLAVGIGREAGPSTPEERIDAISKRLACPVCDGESVFEYRGSASQAIRQEIARQVADAFGVAWRGPEEWKDAREIIRLADEDMYMNKRRGKGIWATEPGSQSAYRDAAPL